MKLVNVTNEAARIPGIRFSITEKGNNAVLIRKTMPENPAYRDISAVLRIAISCACETAG